MLWSSCKTRVIIVHRCYDDQTKACRERLYFDIGQWITIVMLWFFCKFRAALALVFKTIIWCVQEDDLTARIVNPPLTGILLWSSCKSRVMFTHVALNDYSRYAELSSPFQQVAAFVVFILWSSCIIRVMFMHWCFDDQPWLAGRLQQDISKLRASKRKPITNIVLWSSCIFTVMFIYRCFHGQQRRVGSLKLDMSKHWMNR